MADPGSKACDPPGAGARDRYWLTRMVQGNAAAGEAAFEALFMAYYEDLCRFAVRYVSSPEVVEDLVQGVFSRVWERRRTLDPQQSIRAYLYSAVRNEAFKHLNHQRVRRRHEGQQGTEQEAAWRSDSLDHLWQVQEGPEEVFRRRELEARVEEALAELPERRRHIFVLSRRHGLTYAEIAELLDISIKTVETQMGRALRALEQQFADVISILR